MKYSLIMGTLGRSDPVARFLYVLSRQSLKDFEVIVCDQNRRDDLESFCAIFARGVNMKWLRLDRRGLSHAINAGIQASSGAVLAFPDDDCEYPPDVLAKVDAVLSARSDLAGVTGLLLDRKTGRPSAGRFATDGAELTPRNVWGRHISCSMFVKREFCDEIGGFDEMFGVGAEFGSGEETYFLLRGLYRGYKVAYVPEVAVYHPDPVATFDRKAAERAYNYGLGFGALFKKHIVYYRRRELAPECVRRLVRTLGGAVTYLPSDRDRSGYYLQHLRGGLRGVQAIPRTGADIRGTSMIVRERVPHHFIHGALLLALYYNWYRYPFMINSSDTSPTYSDTPCP